jgi:hypothetical protein
MKQKPPIVSTDDGIEIDRRTEHPAKQYQSISFNREPGSKDTEDNDEHREKHCTPSFSTVDGMEIDRIEGCEANANTPISRTSEGLSNTT